MVHPTQLIAGESILAVVDVQEKLIPRIDGAEALVRNIGFLLDAARILDVPAVGTEQYPRGLGPTVAALAEKLPQPLPDKACFRCCAVVGFIPDLRARGKSRVVLTGIETHVCVLNTALDLLAAGIQVY